MEPAPTTEKKLGLLYTYLLDLSDAGLYAGGSSEQGAVICCVVSEKGNFLLFLFVKVLQK